MRSAVVGVVIVSCLLIVLASDSWRSPLQAQTPPRAVGELIALNSDVRDGRQQVVVIDSRSRVMSVYHVEHGTGVISLKSVRKIESDLLMDEFNTGNPLPREIRAILDQR